MDAKILYGDNGGVAAMNRMRKGVEMVNVVEVVSDRWSGRVRGWGTFVEGEKGIRNL